MIYPSAGAICIVKMTTIPVLTQSDFSCERHPPMLDSARANRDHPADNSMPLVIWGFVEPAATIAAASIPMMRHLFRASPQSGLPTTQMSTSVHNSVQQNTANANNRANRAHRAYQQQQEARQQRQQRQRQQNEPRRPQVPEDNQGDMSMLSPPGSTTHTLGMSDSGDRTIEKTMYEMVNLGKGGDR